ncbi:hypothetical protein [Methylosinus sp. LW4]|uniref:hypothetical protein n=1 Tax=Methylosinus sp. LW4 TaxID=136993 RepID=UPI0003764B22|nr:hypothetical protein [Methylosinus sp. LW4]
MAPNDRDGTAVRAGSIVIELRRRLEELCARRRRATDQGAPTAEIDQIGREIAELNAEIAEWVRRLF